MPTTTRTPSRRRRATVAALAVSVASLAAAGSAAALPLSAILPGLGVTPPAGTVTTPGAGLTTPGAVLTTPGATVDSIVVESLRLPAIVAKVKAAVDARADLGLTVSSVDLPTVATPPIGSAVVRAPGGREILATPPVSSITTPERTPAVTAKAKLRVKVEAAAKAKVKLPRTPRIATPVVLLPPTTVAAAPKTVSVPARELSF